MASKLFRDAAGKREGKRKREGHEALKSTWHLCVHKHVQMRHEKKQMRHEKKQMRHEKKQGIQEKTASELPRDAASFYFCTCVMGHTYDKRDIQRRQKRHT